MKELTMPVINGAEPVHRASETTSRGEGRQWNKMPETAKEKWVPEGRD